MYSHRARATGRIRCTKCEGAAHRRRRGAGDHQFAGSRVEHLHRSAGRVIEVGGWGGRAARQRRETVRSRLESSRIVGDLQLPGRCPLCDWRNHHLEQARASARDRLKQGESTSRCAYHTCSCQTSRTHSRGKRAIAAAAGGCQRKKSGRRKHDGATRCVCSMSQLHGRLFRIVATQFSGLCGARGHVEVLTTPNDPCHAGQMFTSHVLAPRRALLFL